uniref:Uncharacterized protein n=1 Tax=Zea mays TaxID=4577 RepID=B7ZZG7_MAIZE|nr:unknown [Zea mays]
MLSRLASTHHTHRARRSQNM